jgi:PTS system D-glucosamine-specific IIC component
MNMSDYFIYILIAVVLIVLVWFIFAKGLKNKKPKEVTLKDIPIDLEALINAFGGINNIKETEAQGSKIRVFVENDDLVKVNVLKELGASGIIQSTGKVTVILGKFSSEISGIINDKK